VRENFRSLSWYKDTLFFFFSFSAWVCDQIGWAGAARRVALPCLSSFLGTGTVYLFVFCFLAQRGCISRAGQTAAALSLPLALSRAGNHVRLANSNKATGPGGGCSWASLRLCFFFFSAGLFLSSGNLCRPFLLNHLQAPPPPSLPRIFLPCASSAATTTPPQSGGALEAIGLSSRLRFIFLIQPP
jgi:hypothetical protein